MLREATSKMQALFKDRLTAVILYGSCARQDFNDESDVDIALIVNMGREEIKKYDCKIVELMNYIMMKFEILLSINEIPLSEFEEYKDTLPYYKAINKEGVRIDA